MENLKYQPAENGRSTSARQLVETELFGRVKVDHYYPTVDGTKIHYTESGLGSRVIVLGGLPLFAWEGFVGFIKPFAKNHKVCVFEYPGFGESDVLRFKHNFENVTEILHRTIQQEGLGPAHIVGLSFGGGVALHLAAKHPEDVRSLTLQGVPMAFSRWIRDKRRVLTNRVISHLAEKTFDSIRLWPFLFAFLISDPQPAKKLYGQRWIERLAKKYEAKVFSVASREYAHSILETDENQWREVCQKITVPTVILASTRRELFHGTADKLAKLIPQAKKAMNPDTATFLGHGKGKPFAEVTLPFIEEIGRS